MFYNTLELSETYIKLDFKTHTMNLHGKRTRQCGTVMPGNEVQALQPTSNNVPASLQKFGKKQQQQSCCKNTAVKILIIFQEQRNLPICFIQKNVK